MMVLQNIIFPGFNRNTPEEMYFRKGKDNISFNDKKEILFGKYGTCSFDTYFNGLMLDAWSGKAKISSLNLRLYGRGKFQIKIFLERFSSSRQSILEKEILLSDQDIDLKIDSVLQWQDGMVYFELIAMDDDAIFSGGNYWTEDCPINEVKLGIVITHFNRKNYVIPAIKRITNNILKDPKFLGKIHLIVVDNSSNILPEESGMAKIIANQNLGGSGGFTRGLLHLVEDGSFTHCLFMDDDASCEIESILRCYTILCYVSEEKFAISGSQLRESISDIIQEKGAVFKDINYHPLYQNLSVIDRFNVIKSELFYRKINYGGWWFFAFKISDVKFYPYPFFIRGDDVLFGIVNNFNIFTVSGISCWAEDFFVKENPLTRYFALRGTFVCSLLTENVSMLFFIKKYTQWFLANLLSYNYGSAQATIFAMNDIMSGPSTFIDDLTASKVREKIKPLQLEEKMVKINRENVLPVFVSIRENYFRKIFRILTLNGFLLPSFFMKNNAVFQHKHFKASFREVFMFKEIYYEYESEHTGYVAMHNKKRFFQLLWMFTKSLYNCVLRYKKIKQEYRLRMPEMTSLAFWHSVYSNNINVVKK